MKLALFALAMFCSVAQAAQRPNFIFILTDDQRWDAMGVVQREQGGKARFPWFETPNMDRIAAEGVRFRNSFVTLSLCSPSRAAFLTGQYNHINGVVNNRQSFPAQNVTYAALMRAAGYETGFFGKFHHGTQAGPRPGFGYNASFIGQGVYFDCPFEVNGQMVETKGWVDDVITDYAIEFLKQPHQKPFSMFIATKSPHGPNLPPERAARRFEGSLARVVPSLASPAVYLQGKDKSGRLLKAKEAIQQGHDLKVNLNYFRCISAVDDNVGRILEALDALKLSDNTVLVFTSDNGNFQGEHLLGDKRGPYEESLRIPMLVRYPKNLPKGKVVDEMVLNIDLAPTFLEWAGIPVPNTMQGHSWVPLFKGGGSQWRKSFLAQYFMERDYPNTPTFLALRTETGKLVQYPGHEDWAELFDLKNDPHETRNLAQDPAYGKLREELSAELQRQVKAVNYSVPPSADKAAESKQRGSLEAGD